MDTLRASVPDIALMNPAPQVDALVVEHLTVSFRACPVVDDLSFSVAAGSAFAIIGPSGAGKTVLLKALIGSIPYLGRVRWASGTRLGYVPQKLDLARDLPLTGVEFLRAKCEVLREPIGELERVLALVELSHRVARQPIGTLSGGQFQRLLLGFALLGRPTVLLFDEPTAGLDEPGVESIYARFNRLRVSEQLTLILVSHELSLVYRHADVVLCLSHLHRFIGPPMDILTPERLQQVYGRPMRYHQHHDDARR